MNNKSIFDKFSWQILKKFKKYLLLIYYLISISPFFPYFLKLPLAPARDWNYFNSLGLLIGESIKELRLPLLDPWVCGGLDILSNPQSWVYSPFIILNFLFHPYLANLFSLLICTVFGFWGMLKLCERFNDTDEKYLFAALFNLSPFFFLHFAEGHIPFRTFYFLPFVFYFSISFRSLKQAWWLVLVLIFMLLDGGIYPFCFSLILILINLNYSSLKQLIKRDQFKNLIILFFSGLLLTLSKILPVLFIHQSRIPEFEQVHYSFSNIVQAFFDIRQSNYISMKNQIYFSHEYAHYIGIGFSLLFLSLIPQMKQHLKLVLQLILFGWIALGVGGDFNPWAVVKNIPLLNQLHVQSRFLISFFLIALILIIKTYRPGKGRQRLLYLTFFEFLFCAFYISTHAFGNTVNLKDFRLSKNSFPTNRYENYIEKPYVYSSGRISHQCYEPANPKLLKPNLHLFLNMNQPALAVISNQTIKITSVDPMRESFVLNEHWNGGWDCIEGCETFSNNGLIQINPKNTSEIVIKYNPVYWQTSLACFVLGLFFMLLVRRRIFNDL